MPNQGVEREVMTADRDLQIADLQREVERLRVEAELQRTIAETTRQEAEAQLAKVREYITMRKAAERSERLSHAAELDAIRSELAELKSRPLQSLLPDPLRRRLEKWREWNRLRADIRTIRRSGLFDADWYSARYGDVARSGLDPLYHYVRYGALEGRDPSPDFDTDWYCQRYAEVRNTVLNPLLDYIRSAADGRDPSPVFRTAWYLSAYPDVKKSGLNPLLHFRKFGRSQGRSPVPAGR
jgi:hypothetical protein